MRTLTLLWLAACGGPTEDTSPTGPQDGCLSAPVRVQLVNKESARPVARGVALTNGCGVELTAALSIVDADGVGFEDDITSIVLPDGESTSVSLDYLPDAPGSSTGSLIVDPGVAGLTPVEVEISAEAPGARWNMRALVQAPLVRECAGEMQVRFENVGEGKGVRPKASLSATGADVTLTRSVLPEEGAANLDAKPVILHAATAELVITVDDAFAGQFNATSTLTASEAAEREELFAAGAAGPVTLAEAPLEASIRVLVDDVAVTGWTLAGLDLTVPESVDRLTDDVVVQYVAASSCN
jgi:hypothetical protein